MTRMALNRPWPANWSTVTRPESSLREDVVFSLRPRTRWRRPQFRKRWRCRPGQGLNCSSVALQTGATAARYLDSRVARPCRIPQRLPIRLWKWLRYRRMQAVVVTPRFAVLFLDPKRIRGRLEIPSGWRRGWHRTQLDVTWLTLGLQSAVRSDVRNEHPRDPANGRRWRLPAQDRKS